VEAHTVDRDELADWGVPALGCARCEVNSERKACRDHGCPHPKVLIHRNSDP
jgi:hypothetical protein